MTVAQRGPRATGIEWESLA